MKLIYHYEVKPYHGSDRIELVVKDRYRRKGEIEHGNITVYPERLQKKIDKEREEHHKEWFNRLEPFEKEFYNIIKYDMEFQIEKWLTSQLHTTANVRFGFLKKILTKIVKATSYIRKRCVKFFIKD